MSLQTKQLRIGIIGLGVGEAHIAGYHAHPDCRVVALCDQDAEKCRRLESVYPDMTLSQQDSDILTDPEIDIVSIASYDDDHYQQIVTALEHDKHIFVEKPLCLKREHAAHIRELLNQKPQLKISSNLILRKCPRFIELRNKIQHREFGELFSIEGDYNYGRLHKVTEGWRGKLDFYSIVLGGGVHIIDLMQWLTEDDIVEVFAYGNQIASRGSQFRFNDLVTCVFKFKSGMVGKMSVNFGCVQPHHHNLNIYGTKATFTNQMQGGYLYTSRDASVEPRLMEQPYPGVHKGDLIREFVQAVIDDREPAVSREEIFRAISVCFAIDESIHRGPTKVDYI